MKPPPARTPQRDRASKAGMIDAGPTVDRAEETDELVGRDRSDACAHIQEAALHVRTVDGIEAPIEPVVRMVVQYLAVRGPGSLREGRASGEV